MTAPDYSHAIGQLRWLIEHDFHERHGEWWESRDECPAGRDPTSRYSRHWWDSPVRRKDIVRLRSYIAAVRVLEALLPPKSEPPMQWECLYPPGCVGGRYGASPMCCGHYAQLMNNLLWMAQHELGETDRG